MTLLEEERKRKERVETGGGLLETSEERRARKLWERTEVGGHRSKKRLLQREEKIKKIEKSVDEAKKIKEVG